MHSNAHAIFQKYGEPHIPAGARVLEVGIGKRWWLSPYLKMAPEKKWQHHFCDLGNFGSDQPGFIRQTYEYYIGGSGSSDFDAVISQQCFEHTKNPFKLAAELCRVLKKGGVAIIIVPLTWRLHKNPVDCWRIHPDGMKAILEESGFRPILCKSEHICENEAEKNNQIGHVQTTDTIGIGRKL